MTIVSPRRVWDDTEVSERVDEPLYNSNHDVLEGHKRAYPYIRFASEKQILMTEKFVPRLPRKMTGRQVRVQARNQLKSLSRRTAETEEYRDDADAAGSGEQSNQTRRRVRAEERTRNEAALEGFGE